MTTWWPWARLVMALLIAAALIAQLTRTVQNAIDEGWHLPTVVWNYFSFFTVESNAFAMVVLAIAAVCAWKAGTGREPGWLALLLVLAATYMVTTGIVYNLLLRGYQLPQGSTVPWSNEILHVVAPLFLLLDVLFAPRRRGLPWSALWAVVAFPVVWVASTLIRANLITSPATSEPWWYPYPFLNPHHFENGYFTVAVYIVGIAIAIVVVGAGVIWVGRRRADARERQVG